MIRRLLTLSKALDREVERLRPGDARAYEDAKVECGSGGARSVLGAGFK